MSSRMVIVVLWVLVMVVLPLVGLAAGDVVDVEPAAAYLRTGVDLGLSGLLGYVIMLLGSVCKELREAVADLRAVLRVSPGLAPSATPSG